MDLVDHIVGLYMRLQRLEGRLAGKARHGTVQEIDTAKQLVRLRIGGTEDEPYLSPWIPYGQVAGPGTGLKVHAPPTIGQSMTLVSPAGDLRQSVAMPFTWSDQAAAPGTTGDPVLTYGQVKVEVGAEALTLTVGSAVIKAATDGITIELDGKGFMIDGTTLQMTHKFTAKDPVGKPAHYVSGIDSGGDRALDGNANVVM
jgi:phage baseplate assembly protein gpV